jgi:hypothetical protein
MHFTDVLLKLRVNLAMARDPRVRMVDVSVHAENGSIRLSGDVRSPEEQSAATEIARSVEGVIGVENQMTLGMGVRAETAERLVEAFLRRLDEEWIRLPNHNALSQCSYLHWALMATRGFHIPEDLPTERKRELEAEAFERALAKIADYVHCSRGQIALDLMLLAESETVAFKLPVGSLPMF